MPFAVPLPLWEPPSTPSSRSSPRSPAEPVSGPLTWLDPGVERYLLVEDGELMRDQVTRHWAASVWPGIRFGVGLWVLAGAFVFTSWFFWVVLVLSLAVVVNAGWALASQFRDRFVVTNQKVYRVHGNLN